MFCFSYLSTRSITLSLLSCAYSDITSNNCTTLKLLTTCPATSTLTTSATAVFPLQGLVIKAQLFSPGYWPNN
ncbi:MAG: hypothetical protein IKF79_04210 [Methanosphaera sp.]|nr:hypothetical protein [Methanosphaera sp.]